MRGQRKVVVRDMKRGGALQRSRGHRLPGVLAALAVLLLPLARWATAGPQGEWYLRDQDRQFTLVLEGDEASLHGYTREGGSIRSVDVLGWDGENAELVFREEFDGGRWYRGRIADGIFKGRAAWTGGVAEPSITHFQRLVSGWNSTVLDQDIVPRAFDLVVNGSFRAHLRIDRNPAAPGAFIGQMKVYANNDPVMMHLCRSATPHNRSHDRWDYAFETLLNIEQAAGADCEELEFDVEIGSWDGHSLGFVRRSAHYVQTYSGTVSGNRVSGVFSDGGGTEMPWHGWRAEVLGAGLAPPAGGLESWQARSRARLAHLQMAGAPQPLTRSVTVVRQGLPPQADGGGLAGRDDNPAAWPQDYQLSELDFEWTLPDPYGTEPLVRQGHGYLAVPGPHSGRRPAALVLNGHGGSAWLMLDPRHTYWYGDAFARRGYITLALDVSHRGYGDSPATGNGPHPPIAAPGMPSDWSEDGERAWTAMRALDYLLSRPDVDPRRIVVAGLSLGGEVAALVAALDTRVTTAVVAGYTPDFAVMTWNGNHGCWQLPGADLREYVNMSDYLALIAPRPLFALTGKRDGVFSRRDPPFSADKQVLRRARLATAETDWSPVHYLHDGGHEFRVGDRTASGGTAEHVQVPIAIAPSGPGAQAWQLDAATTSLGKTLFELIEAGVDHLFEDGFEAHTPGA